MPAQADDLEAAMAAKTGDYPTAIARWQAFAQQGDADAAYRLGQAYDNGTGVPPDPAAAQHWYGVAAAAGSGRAAYALGMMAEETERPDGMPQNLAAAVDWYRKAAADGDPRAAERLAALGAADGASAAPRRPAAPDRAWTPVATRPPTHLGPPDRPAAPPDPARSFDRAVALWRARGIDARDPAAVAALEAAAKQGHPLAQYDLAYAYAHGLGVPAEPARAYAWYKRAAASNGPARLREAAEANWRQLGDRLSDQDKQMAERAGD